MEIIFLLFLSAACCPLLSPSKQIIGLKKISKLNLFDFQLIAVPEFEITFLIP